MRIDIWSDLVCPWCYIGKRRLERALAAFPHKDDVEIVHRSFQLDPSMKRGAPVDQRELLVRKYGLSGAQADAMETQMEGLASAEGLVFNRRGGVIGNTLDGHRLVQLAKARGLQDVVIERLYRAHFTEQRSIFDHESLVVLAEEAGLDPDAARQVLAGDAYTDGVASDIDEARALGISGVPFFLIERYGVSGAQAPEVFAGAFQRAWAMIGQTMEAARTH